MPVLHLATVGVEKMIEIFTLCYYAVTCFQYIGKAIGKLGD